jgi:hypothetical protein
MDKFFKRNLRDVYEYKNFKALRDFKEEMIKRLESQNVIGTTEYETLVLTLSKEFKKQALNEFFEDLEKEITQDD